MKHPLSLCATGVRLALACSFATSIALAGCGAESDDGPGVIPSAGVPSNAAGAIANSGGRVGQSTGGNSGGNSGGSNDTGGSRNATGGASGGATGGATAGSTGGRFGRGGNAGTGETAGTVVDAGTVDTGGGAELPTGGKEFPKKFAGNITTNNQVRSDFKTLWDQITPENEGKWGSVQRAQGSFNWTSLDAIYKYANDNNILFKEHCFVWGAQQPGWVNSSNAETAVKTWMKSFCERYPKTKIIDVVNEPPPHTTPGYKDGMGGSGTSGWDWIANAFKWAREACPDAILVLNDYNTIEYGNDNSHIIDIVTKIKAAGAPIDAVGCQAHDAYKIKTATVQGFVDKITTQTGLPTYITEYDIGIADDNQQKNVMQEQFTMYWTDPNVKGVTIWGYVVGATWRANTGLMSSGGAKRPALTWLMDYLKR